MSGTSSLDTHPIVRLDYPLRVIGQFFVLVTVISGVTGEKHNLLFWGGLLVTSMVWPHLAYRLGLTSSDSKRAELRNLLGDSAIISLWITQLSFALWPSTAFVTAATMSNLAAGGVRQGLRSLAVMIGVAITCRAGFGVHFEPESDLRTGIISVVTIFLFTAFLGLRTNESTRRLVESRTDLKNQRDEIGKKNRELEEARQAAESANRAKSSFLANMNHELHTPLHAIIGYADLVAEEAQEHNVEGIDTDLRRIKKSADHLLSIVDSVLDFTRIESGNIQLNLEAIDLGELSCELEATLQQPLATKGNVLDVSIEDTGRWVLADRVRLEEVLLGLLTNATNFTESGTITLDIRREQEEISFSVRDTGEGIPQDELDQIFSPFYQVDASTTRKVGGVGLGLAVCRKLCNLMGGELTVSSEPGKGSQFGFLLPASDETSNGGVAKAAEALPDDLVEEAIEMASTSPDAPEELAPIGRTDEVEIPMIPSSRKHDLLTPVNHIIGYGELLAEDAADAGQQELLSGLEKICANGRALEKIITFQFEAAKKVGTGVGAACFHAEMDPVLDDLKVLAEDLLGRVTGDTAVEDDLSKIMTAIESLTKLTHESEDLQRDVTCGSEHVPIR